MHLVSK